MSKQVGIINREARIIFLKMEILELKSTITEVKKELDRLTSVFEMAEERICECER